MSSAPSFPSSPFLFLSLISLWVGRPAVGRRSPGRGGRTGDRRCGGGDTERMGGRRRWGHEGDQALRRAEWGDSEAERHHAKLVRRRRAEKAGEKVAREAGCTERGRSVARKASEARRWRTTMAIDGYAKLEMKFNGKRPNFVMSAWMVTPIIYLNTTLDVISWRSCVADQEKDLHEAKYKCLI
uniref:Uncharacterized protein n=1 Tax=Oryza sativa subsp. japonica TaxID=39947 RepID=Q2R1Z7_ORYSJ|nr:hypothetical protein LOC_Os11g37530 [Oryza sativa Japonica Group]